jgi:hypothetical protein
MAGSWCSGRFLPRLLKIANDNGFRTENALIAANPDLQRSFASNYDVVGLVPFFMGVAVGTTIADRPPRRSVRARLRIKCDGTHFMRYVASRFMCRPVFTTVRISEPVHLDTT